jgi:REP element-mobilizing transposase RayT
LVTAKWASSNAHFRETVYELCNRMSHRFSHGYHIVWVTKYRYKVLEGTLCEPIRTIIRQLCEELGVQVVSGVLSKEHVHIFVEIPPQIAVSDFVNAGVILRRLAGAKMHHS